MNDNRKPWAYRTGLMFFIYQRVGRDEWVVRWPPQMNGFPTNRRSGDDGPGSEWTFMENGDTVIMEMMQSKLVLHADGTIEQVKLTPEQMAEEIARCET